MRNFDLHFSERRTFVFSGVCMTLRIFGESYSSNLSQNFWALPRKSPQIPAALSPEIRNPTVVHFSMWLLHFCHHPSSAFRWVVPQPACVQMNTCRRIYNPIQTYRIDIREDANSHKVIKCKYFSRSFCTAVDRTSHRCSQASEVLFPRRTSTSLCWWLRGWSCFWCWFCTLIPVVPESTLVLEHCPFAFH